MTYIELKKMQGSLARIFGSQKLPAPAAFRASKFAKRMVEAMNELEEVRVKTAKKYAGDAAEVPADRLEEFHAEMNNIMQEETSLPELSLTLEEVKEVGLSPFDFSVLGDIIKE